MSSRLSRTARSLCALIAAAAMFGLAPPAGASPGRVAAPPAPTPTSSTPTPANATAANAQWSVSPVGGAGTSPRAYFVYTVKPGTTVTDYVAVSNFGAQPLTLKLYPTDAFNTAQGQFALLPASQKPTDDGAWISLPVSSVTVPPGKQVQIPFHVAVPTRAAPGDHAAGIVAARTVQQVNAKGTPVAVDERVAARMYLRVDGPLQPALAIKALRVSYSDPLYPIHNHAATVSFTVKNTGNVALGGNAVVRLSGAFGVAVAHSALLTIPPLLPDSTYSASLTLTGVFPAGWLTAHLNVALTAGVGLPAVPGPAVAQTSTIRSIPWLLLGIVLALILVIWWWIHAWRRRRRHVEAAAERRPPNRPRRPAVARPAAPHEGAAERAREDGSLLLLDDADDDEPSD